jgi:HSP20 family protein
MTKAIFTKNHHHAVPALAGTWQDFRQEFERLFDHFSEGFDGISLQPFTAMQKWFEPVTGKLTHLCVDVAENEKAYVISAELAGVAEKDVEVVVHEDMLVISGEKKPQRENQGDNRYITERSYGSFRRMFHLPRGTDAEGIEARFSNGILEVMVPKTAERPQSRKVDVTTG